MATNRQQRRRQSRRQYAAQRRERKCLYCLGTDGPFSSEEHITPFALGNRDKILRPGAVCDPCNNGPLSQLDSELVSFAPIALMRVHLGLEGRGGTIPPARFANAHISRKAKDELLIDSKNGKPVMVPDPAKPGAFKLNLTGRRMTEDYARVLVRALFKSTLGFIYLDHGPKLAMAERFDETRRIVLGAEPSFRGYLAMPKRTEPTPTASFTYQFVDISGTPTVAIWADFYGVQMLTDLESRRIINPDRVPRDEVSLIEFGDPQARY